MSVAEAVLRVRERIEEACRRSGRRSEEIALMGVSKFRPAEDIVAAYGAGIRLFGESRVQEAAEKFPELLDAHGDMDLHLIGSLQRNKAKAAVSLFSCVQSVDRDELIRELGLRASGRPEPLDILFELHTAEESKSGYEDLAALCAAAEAALARPSLRIRGLMTMAPYTPDQGPIRASFRALRSARDALAVRFPEADWSVLSMGMSNDFEIAVEEGSSLLRIGTALFSEDRL